MTGEDLKCSFCNKQQAQVKKLIKGLEANICDECINHFTVSVERPMKILIVTNLNALFAEERREMKTIFFMKKMVYIFVMSA